jgi:hypothetical protein
MNATAGLPGCFILCRVYATQHGVRKSCKELPRLNGRIDRLIENRHQ